VSAIPNLDIEDAPRLIDYLRGRGVIATNETPVIRTLEGGVSNRVVSVTRTTGEPYVLKQALEKLRVQVDWFCTPTRIDREALALRYLVRLAPAGTIPALIFQDSQQHLLAMAQVPDPHQSWKQLLLRGDVSADYVEQFGRLLGSIHSGSATIASQMEEVFGDRSIFEALRVEPYYQYTASRLPESASFLEALIKDMLGCRISLVHGDYSPKNILIHEHKLVLLDFEAVHFGDPAFDIGFSMAHFLGKANHLETQRSAFAQAAIRYWQVYSDCLGPHFCISELERRAVRHSLACCLARARGRSPLEYLAPNERSAQANAVLGMLNEPPATIPELVTEFVRRLPCRSSNG